jgi:hypothetical protein
MSDAAGDIIGIELPIESDGGVECVDQLRGFSAKSSPLKFFVFHKSSDFESPVWGDSGLKVSDISVKKALDTRGLPQHNRARRQDPRI